MTRSNPCHHIGTTKGRLSILPRSSGRSESDQETTEQFSGARSGVIYLLWASGLRFGVYCYHKRDDPLDKTTLQTVYLFMEISSYINSVIISNYRGPKCTYMRPQKDYQECDS